MFGSFGLPELLVLLVIFMSLLVVLVPGIFFLLTVQKALERCAPESRTMSPGEVWLMLIPLFNVVWQFIMVLRVSSSLANEFCRRNLPIEAEPGQALGLACCILIVISIIPVIGFLSGIAALVCWIMYWVKIADYSSQLAAAPARN